jgi:membrane-associated protease RseP (regulator of RpoE activity)
MTAPKNLWSGDWRRESAAAAEHLAQRRGRTDAPAEPPPAEAPASRPFREPLARLVAAVRSARPRRVRGAVLIAIATLLSAVIAYAAVSALVSPSSKSPAQIPPRSRQASTSGTGTAWLGVDTTSFPLAGGVMILDVAPGSPADAAGLESGDIITEVDSRAVQTPADLELALAGLHAGQQVQIGYDRGPISLTTEATLTTRPAGP